MSYVPKNNCLDLELRGALRRVINGSTFYESARFHGVKIEDLFSFYRSVQESMYNHFGLDSSNFKLEDLVAQKSPPEGLLRFMIRRFGQPKTIRFLCSFYLLTEKSAQASLEQTVSAYLLPREQFPRYLGCKALIASHGVKQEVYIAFGPEQFAPKSNYPFTYRCEQYEDFISALEGGYGFELDEVIGFLSVA